MLSAFTLPSLRTLCAGLITFGLPAFASLANAETTPPATLQAGAEPIVFTVERSTAAPDGRTRPVMTINGSLPGPTMRAKENEIIRVKVVNKMDVPTTMHWHGMYQVGTNNMDGVPNITGPAIAPGAEFLYQFKASPAGTHWYHSHVAEQESDGLLGALIIEEAQPIAQATRDQVLLINDWYLLPGEQIVKKLRTGAYMEAMGMTPKQGDADKGGMKMPGMGKGGMEGMEGMGGMGGMGNMDMGAA